MATVESRTTITDDDEKEWAELSARVAAVTDPEKAATITTDEVSRTVVVTESRVEAVG